MYAIIETGGKQYKVEQNDEIFIEKLNVEEGDSIELKAVAVSSDKGLEIGSPYVENAKVSATVVKNGKAKKITVFTYKPKKSIKRKLGHRQPYTKIKIDSITA
ncbi:MAG: 50S ribosomal protein L21 [Clostridia bacterium]|nr:50S ribosomal protein L21 [Clostridia bacterium]